MKIANSKLLSILVTFTKIELNRVKKYIRSPYFNKSQDIINLFFIMEKMVTSTRKEIIFNKEKVWKKLFPTKKYDDLRFRKLNSDLLKLVEDFLAQEVYEQNPIHKATYLIEAVGNKRLKKLYNTTMNTARRLSDKQVNRHANFYFHQYQIEKNYYTLTGFDINRSDVSNVEDIINNLDYFYLAEKLKYYCEILTRSSVFTYEYELLFIDEIVEHVNKYGYDKTPPVAIYYQMCLVQLEPENENHFYKLKDLLNEFALIFPLDEAKSLYTTAINYCIQKINIGSENFLGEFLSLNEELLQKGIIGEGDLSPWRFKNVVTVALRMGRYEWTEQFIKNYYKKIPDKFRENAYTFNLASLFYYKKEYDKVLELLQTVEYEDFTYSLSSKTMLITSYYELDEIEALFSLMDSFRVFLNRQKDLTSNRKQRFLNFIKFTRKLANSYQKDQKVIEKIKLEITNEKEVSGKSWLLEKIAELEK